MAGGQLVPHTLPDGRTVMVPDYLVPGGAALSMPTAPKPADPDMRIASNGPAPILSQLSPDFAKVQQFSESKPDAPSPLGQAVVTPPEDAEQRRKRIDAERATEAAKEHVGKKDPAKLKPVPKADPRRESDVIAETAADLYGKRGGGGARPAANPENLRPVVAEIKQQRQPGMRLLPEQEWRLGLSERPKDLYELDPDAQQPTWGTEEPVMREKLTPLEKGANMAGEYARSEFERQVQDQREMGLAQRQMLAQQSELMDQQLSTIAARRDRIAKLQETADKRMQEAESFEPRTREQVWEDKGTLAQAMGILAMMIGGYTAGLGRSGGRNPGLDIINKILDSAVEDERHKAESRRRIGLDAKNDVERALALYGDLDMAMLDAKNRKLANVMAMTQQHLADRGLDVMAKDRAAQIYAAAQEQYLANKQQLFDQITGKVTTEEATLRPYGQVIQTATPKPVGGGVGPKGITGDKLKGLSEDMIARAVKLPNGTFKFVRDRTVREKLQERMNGASDMMSALRQIQALRADKANTIPWQKKRGRIEALSAALLAMDKQKNQMGTLDKGLIEFMGRKFGSPEQFHVIDNTIDGKIEENIRLLNDEVRKTSERDLDDGPFQLTEGGITPDEVRD